MPCAGILRGAKQPRDEILGEGSEEKSGWRRGQGGRAPRFPGERLEVRVAGAGLGADGRSGAAGTAETGSSGQDRPGQRSAGRFFFRALLRCGREPGRRQTGGCFGAGGEEEALPPVQPPSKLRHRQFPAHEAPDLQNFASKLLEIPAVSLQWL